LFFCNQPQNTPHFLLSIAHYRNSFDCHTAASAPLLALSGTPALYLVNSTPLHCHSLSLPALRVIASTIHHLLRMAHNHLQYFCLASFAQFKATACSYVPDTLQCSYIRKKGHNFKETWISLIVYKDVKVAKLTKAVKDRIFL
jgi:hypothetical protein